MGPGSPSLGGTGLLILDTERMTCCSADGVGQVSVGQGVAAWTLEAQLRVHLELLQTNGPPVETTIGLNIIISLIAVFA